MQTHACREKNPTLTVYIVMDITLATTTQERHPAITVDTAVKYVTQGPAALRKKNWT